MDAQQQWELWSIPNNPPPSSARAPCLVVQRANSQLTTYSSLERKRAVFSPNVRQNPNVSDFNYFP
jgi:hypothetical protein